MDSAVQKMVGALEDGSFYRDPYRFWSGLRESAPLVRLPLGGGTWLSTRWAGTAAFSRDPRLSSARAERPPVQLIGRMVVEEFEFEGARLHKGDAVFLGWAAANRDPRQFPDPEQIQLGRHYNPHLAFGAGPHFCMGMHLARIEAQIAFRRIWQRLPGLRLVPGGTEWSTKMLVRGPRKLEVTVS